MACRIGITTNPDERRLHWEVEYPTLHNWKILERHKTRAAAQEAEKRLARSHGCEAHAGGADAPGEWAVYKFDF